MLSLRIAFTAAVIVMVVSLLASGRPLGGLIIVPLFAIWARRAVESGRLADLVQRIVNKPS